MARRLAVVLQWCGALGLCGAVALTVGGFAVLKDRVRIVVQDDQKPTGPDPVALLRDEVASLQRALDELRAVQATQAEQLGQALDERAAARHAEVLQKVQAAQASGAQAAAAEERQAANQRQIVQQIAALRNEVLALHTALPDAAPSAAMTNPALPPTPEPVVAPQPTNQTPAVQPATEPAANPQPTTEPPAPPTRAFLSFRLPETKAQFTDPQDYTLVPDLCRVGFDAKSTLHDFTGVTTQVTGAFHADFRSTPDAWTGSVQAAAAQLATGVDGRDEGLRERLATTQHPQITFAITGFTAEAVDAAQRTARGTVRGTMTIRGQARDVAMPVRFALDPQQRLVVEGQMPLKLSDYGVPVPSQLGGAITMQDQVTVWIALRARPQAKGGK
jgi:polyisoprenoid-binding protein YceI